MQTVSTIQGLDSPLPMTDNVEVAKREDESLREQFLTLLMAQIQNQDPLNPMENTEFTSQIAQFSQLEQLFNLNESFESLKESISSQGGFQAASLIGKDAAAEGNIMVMEGGSLGAPMSFYLPETAGGITLSIYDDGGLVRTLELGGLDSGSQDVYWDGKDFSGTKVPDGRYYFHVDASDFDGNPIQAETLIKGRITSVSFEGGEVILYIDGRPVTMGNLIGITEPSDQ